MRFGSIIVVILLVKRHSEESKLPKECAKERKLMKLTLARGINTFRGIGNSEEAAYTLSFASVKRVPSTKRANQKGRGK